MLRIIGFIVGALVLANLLGSLPIVGGFFRSTGILGLWVSALLLSWAGSWLALWTSERRVLNTKIRSLGAVDTIHAKGKLGSLYLAGGRASKALPLLEAAAVSEPESLEWRYRLGVARLGNRDFAGAREALEFTVSRDSEYGFGNAQLRLAEAAQLEGDANRALGALVEFERNHGPSPESAYRRGCAHAALEQTSEADRAFDEVSPLAKEHAKYQKKSSFRWIAATWRVRLLGR